ncbi:MAG: cellulase family glycosylhydrolase, partial [Butyrivibrio sp.]|nr:cellulase family glycosylhydrolase [Butyrivibrio sp.]
MKKFKHLILAVACIILTVCVMSVDIFIIKGFNYLRNRLPASHAASAQSSDISETPEADDSDFLTASAFINAMSVGWNLGNSLDSHYGEPTGDANFNQETIWGNPKISKELIDYVYSLGFNTIRIPVSWYYHSYTDSSGHLVVNRQWLQRVKEVVD